MFFYVMFYVKNVLFLFSLYSCALPISSKERAPETFSRTTFYALLQINIEIRHQQHLL